MEKFNPIEMEMVTEAGIAAKELDGRVYFEAMPLDTLVPVNSLWGKEERPPVSAVLGVRG